MFGKIGKQMLFNTI